MHPCAVRESDTLSQFNSPDLTYNLRYDHAGALSEFQTQTVRAACQSLERFSSFLLADGTGVGKGRCLAAIAAEYLSAPHQNRILWFSANKALGVEASRDLEALKLNSLCFVPNLSDQSVAYCTYGIMAVDEGEKFEMIFDWLSAGGQKGTTLLLLDEAHMLRRRSRAAKAILKLHHQLQEQVGNTRNVFVVYSSATLASHPSQLKFVANTLCGGTKAFQTLQRGGYEPLETLAIDLKITGHAACRHLDQKETCIRNVVHELSFDEMNLYDICAERLDDAGVPGTIRQLFFRSLAASFKARTVVRLAQSALAHGKSVVIGLQLTGAATSNRREAGFEVNQAPFPSMIDLLSQSGVDLPELALPQDAIDILITSLGGKSNVAEITGRKKRSEKINGGWQRVRVPNLREEVEAFQSQSKRVAIISKAGSTGIGLHGTGVESAGRLHIMLEMPWAAEDLLQMLGRTFRVGSRAVVDYVVVRTSLAIDARVSLALQRRLKTLAALTRAERSSCKWLVDGFDLGAAQRRNLATHLLLARAIRMNPDAPFRPEASISPEEARQRLGLVNTTSVNFRSLVCAMLEEELPRANRSRQVALAIAALGQQSKRWFQRIGSDSLPVPVQLVKNAIWNESCNSKSMISRLSDDLIQKITSIVVNSMLPSLEDVAACSERLLASMGTLHMMVLKPICWTLNRAVLLSVNLQTTLLKLADLHQVHDEKDKSVLKELSNYVLDEGLEISEIKKMKTIHKGYDRIYVSVKANDGLLPEVWSINNQLACVDRDGPEVRVKYIASPAELFTNEEWNRCMQTCQRASPDLAKRFHNNILRARQRKAAKRSGIYVLATDSFLKHWDESEKVVLRSKELNVVGLLLKRE